MKTKILIITALTAILLLGCTGGKVTLGKPEIRSISYEWGEITQSTTEILTKIVVYNPNPVPLPLKDVLTEVYMNDIKMGQGSALQAEIKPNSESTIVISTKIENDKIPEWWVSHIKNGKKSIIKIIGYLVFDLKIMEFKFPIEQSRDIETDLLATLNTNVPQEVQLGPVSLTIESIQSNWGEVDEKYTEIITHVKVYNDNPIPIPMIRLYYLIEMNGIKVGEGESESSTVIQPNSEATLTLVTKIETDKLDDWWVSHIKNGEKTTVKILIQPTVKIGEKEIKFTVAEQEFTFTTHLIFK